MTRLVLSDLVRNRRLWLGVIAVVVVAAFVATIGAGIVETASTATGATRRYLQNASSPVLVFSGFAAVAVLNAAVTLTIALHQRSYAVWQLANVLPRAISLVVMSQLALVGLVGGAAGAVLGALLLRPVFALVFRGWGFAGTINVSLTMGSAVWVVLAIVGVVLLSGVRGARRAGSVSPLEALREPDPPRARMGWGRWGLLLAVLSCAIALAVTMLRGSVELVTSISILLVPLVAAALTVAGPVIMPATLACVTALVPGRWAPSWSIARRFARTRLTQSTAAVSPLMVGIALSGGIYSTVDLLAVVVRREGADASGYRLDLTQGILLLAGPLLISTVGAAAIILMTSRARHRDIALLQAAGATRAVVIFVAVWEALISVVTAAVLGLLAIVIGQIILAASLDLPALVLNLPSILIAAAAGLVVLLVATIVPTLAALRRSPARMLGGEL